MNRSKSLHPHLPFLVTCTAGAFDLEDTARFLIKSPLASGPSLLEQAPAPFWAALQAQSDQHGNMGAKTFRMTLEGTIFTFEGEREAKRRKNADIAPALAVAVPTLVNTRAIQRGEVLVFTDPHALNADAPEATAG